MLKYFKAAFGYHWNLLAFLGAMGFAALSGRADVAIPLVLAAELTYLGLLGANPKFQRYVDARLSREGRALAPPTTSPGEALERLLSALPHESVKRFEALRARCLALRQIAQAIKDPGSAARPMPLDDMQVAGLDRLLWIYLRLLYTQDSLERFLNMERFLDKTGEARLNAEISDLENRLNQAASIADETQRLRVQRTLEDSLQTSRDRLANFRKARDHFELVRLEIERLENKIRSLSELAVNRQEPDYISGQVDLVASSMMDAERTINELQFATGMERLDDAVPPIMQRQVAG